MYALLDEKENQIGKRELLKKFLEMARHNLYHYSKDHLMSYPKPGFEDEWQNAMHECALIETMIDELPELNSSSDEFVISGFIVNALHSRHNQRNEHFLKRIIIKDEEGNKRLFHVDCQLGQDLIKRYDKERDERILKNIDTSAIFTISNQWQKIEKWEWKVK